MRNIVTTKIHQMKKPYKYNYVKNGGHPSRNRVQKRTMKLIAEEKHQHVRAEIIALNKKAEIIGDQYYRFLDQNSWTGVVILVIGWLLIAGICHFVPMPYTYHTAGALWVLLIGSLLYRAVRRTLTSMKQSQWYNDQLDSIHQARAQLYDQYC